MNCKGSRLVSEDVACPVHDPRSTIMSTAPAQISGRACPLTIDELLYAVGDRSGELVGGLIEMAPTGEPQAEIEAALAREIGNFVKQKGRNRDRDRDRCGRFRRLIRFRYRYRLALPSAGRSGAAQAFAVCQVLFPLSDAALVAGLVLSADEGVGATALVGGAIEIAAAAPDAVLDMSAGVLGRLQMPDCLGRRAEKGPQVLAMGAAALNLGRTLPVSGRR